MNIHIKDCIDANLVLLAIRLANAALAAREAYDALEDGHRNQAIGTLLPLEQELEIASALLMTIFTLHRLPEKTAGGAR